MFGIRNISRTEYVVETPHGLKPEWIELEYVEERSDSRTSWIVVTLNGNGRMASGTSPSIKRRHARHGIHRAALATLNALELFSDHVLSCELIDIAATTAGAQSTIIVHLRLSSDGESSEVFGSAVVHDDFAEGAVRAVLDATNLFVHNLIVDNRSPAF